MYIPLSVMVCVNVFFVVTVERDGFLEVTVERDGLVGMTID